MSLVSDQPAISAKASSGGYRPALDGVRALCILFTLANHTPGMVWWVKGGVGVDVFFALSGFLITHLLLSERERTGRLDLPGYFIRRVFRILPYYYLTLVAYGGVVLVLSLLGVRPEDVEQFRHAAPYLATFNAELRPRAAGDIFGHAWTLGIEEKYYLLMPLVLTLWWSRRAWALVLVAALLAGYAAIGGHQQQLASVLRGTCGLLLGSLAAVSLAAEGLRATLERRSMAGLLAALLLLPYLGMLVFPHGYLWNIAISAISAPLVASLWCNQSQAFSRVMRMGPLPFLGRLTYGLYLLHVLVGNVVSEAADWLRSHPPMLLHFILVYGLSVAVAATVHRFVEVPLIALGRRLARERAARAGQD